MPNYQKIMYAFQEKDNDNLIGLDQPSGGYPFVPDTMSGVRLYSSLESIFADLSAYREFSIVKITFTVEKLS